MSLWTGMIVLAETLSYDRLVPFAVAAIAMIFLLASMRRQRQRTARNAADRAPAAPTPTSTAGIHRDLDALLVELQELSRRISAEIDTRFAKLEAAMRDADRRIAVLHRLSREIGAAQPSELRTPQPTQVPAATTTTDPRYSVIYELADAGFSPVDIARDLGRTPGEVELILNLRRQSKN